MNKVYLIGEPPVWLKDFIQENIITITDGEPDLILITEPLPQIKDVIADFQARYIPITSTIDPKEIAGLINDNKGFFFRLPEEGQVELFLAIVNLITFEREKNPITHLPGNEAIRREIETKILKKSGYYLGYVDMNDFKVYNDRYGFEMGDRLIRHLARVMIDCISDGFVGHIGGDDFVFIIKEDRIGNIANICHEFDNSLQEFYPEIDWHKKEIIGRDRDGRERQFRFVHLAISVLTEKYENFQKLNYAASFVKRVSKEKSKNENRSLYVMDKDVFIQKKDRLLRILSGKDRTAKRTAIEMLGELAEEENIGIFLELLKDPDYLIRKSAVYALGKIGKPEVVPFLLSIINDPSPHVRMRTAEALGNFYDERIPESLLKALDDPDIYVKSAALKSIGKLKLKSAIPRILKMNEEKIIPHVLSICAELNDECLIPYVEDKLRIEKFIEEAIDTLGRIGSEKSLLLLLSILNNRKYQAYRSKILKAIYNLSKIPHLKEAVARHRDLIIESLHSEHPYYEMMILHQIGNKKINVKLKRFINDRRSYMRNAAVLYLSNDKRNLRIISQVLLNDPVSYIRQTAARVLVNFGSGALVYLRRALKDSDFDVRQTVARSILQILFTLKE